jgi:tetratricopeptide (TPR) repeat protein
MMLKHLFLFLNLLLTSASFSQTAEQLVKQADLLEKQMKETEAYAKFKEVLKQQPNHLYALVKCSELASRIGKLQTTKQRQQDFYNAAKIYAERAMKVNPNDSDANMVLSVAYGRMALLQSGKEKVAFVREIKNYAERAVTINPNNFKALHVLGKWHYEITNLGVMEKAGLKVFFGGLPKASFDSSLYFYKKAAVLSPGFVLNYLEMAKVYYKTKNKKMAIECLKKALNLPDATSEDKLVKEEAGELLKDWS